MKKSNKQIIKTNIKKQKITFMCVFCFEYLTRIKNHECNESIDAVIIPKKMKEDAMKEHRAYIRKYGKQSWTNQNQLQDEWVDDLAEIERQTK